MRIHTGGLRTGAIITAAALIIAGCVTTPKTPAAAEGARQQLTQLQADPQLSTRAPVAISDAEKAVVAAEVKQTDKVLEAHLVTIAERKVALARALAQTRLFEDERGALAAQRDALVLEARTLEANKARGDAAMARSDAKIARGQADYARNDAANARIQASTARSDADLARIDATAARGEADSAYIAADAATQQSADLQKQLDALKARPTERGMVVTLGDVLFESGKSTLKASGAGDLGSLAAFLKKYPDRSVIIEGHTDSVGSDSFNLGLSQQRADAVKSALVRHGVSGSRLAASGKGESMPVAGNETAGDRQQNRRVEVIISNAVTAAK